LRDLAAESDVKSQVQGPSGWLRATVLQVLGQLKRRRVGEERSVRCPQTLRLGIPSSVLGERRAEVGGAARLGIIAKR
jgi:hypothetical protein